MYGRESFFSLICLSVYFFFVILHSQKVKFAHAYNSAAKLLIFIELKKLFAVFLQKNDKFVYIKLFFHMIENI